MIRIRKLNQINHLGTSGCFFKSNKARMIMLKIKLKIIAPYPNTTTVLSRGCNFITPSKFPFFLFAFSTHLNITAAMKQQLQIKTTFEKNLNGKNLATEVSGSSSAASEFLYISVISVFNFQLLIFNKYYPFLPVSIGTKEKLSNASSLTLPSAFFVIRSMRW
jgi:hypothetical protein